MLIVVPDVNPSVRLLALLLLVTFSWVPLNVKPAEVVVVFVLLLNNTLSAVPSTFVAGVDVVEVPLYAPENVVQASVLLDDVNVN